MENMPFFMWSHVIQRKIFMDYPQSGLKEVEDFWSPGAIFHHFVPELYIKKVYL